jgi:hypothetical protein
MTDWECLSGLCSDTYDVVDDEEHIVVVVVVVIVVVRPFWWLYRLEENEDVEDDELNVNVAVRDVLMRRISSVMARSSPSIVMYESRVNILSM